MFVRTRGSSGRQLVPPETPNAHRIVAIHREGARNRPATERSDDQHQRKPMSRMQEQMQFLSKCEDCHCYSVIEDEMGRTFCQHAQGQKRRGQEPELPGVWVLRPG